MSANRGRPTDVYALGACLYTFIFGRIPFNAPNVFKLFQVVQHEPLRFPESPAVSNDLKDLLLRMLCKASPCLWTEHPYLLEVVSIFCLCQSEYMADGQPTDVGNICAVNFTCDVFCGRCCAMT